MATILKLDGEDMADIAKVDGYDVPTGVIVHDTQDKDVDSQATSTSRIFQYEESAPMYDEGDEVILLTITLACAQATVLQAAYFICAGSNYANSNKLQMFIDGVAQGETSYISLRTTAILRVYDIGYGAVASGNRTVYLNAHNYSSNGTRIDFAGGIFAGCCKL